MGTRCYATAALPYCVSIVMANVMRILNHFMAMFGCGSFESDCGSDDGCFVYTFFLFAIDWRLTISLAVRGYGTRDG